jgi:hypothetical protein
MVNKAIKIYRHAYSALSISSLRAMLTVALFKMQYVCDKLNQLISGFRHAPIHPRQGQMLDHTCMHACLHAALLVYSNLNEYCWVFSGADLGFFAR